MDTKPHLMVWYSSLLKTMIDLQKKDPELKKRTSCINCGVVFSNKSYYSLKGSRGMCKHCYMRWLWTYGYRECVNCKSYLKTPQVVPYCRLCKKQIKDGLMENPNIRGLGKRKPKDNFDKPLDKLTRLELIDVKLLLLRFKVGSQTPVDYYKTIHFYTKIWDIDVKLDSYEPDIQVAYMLKRLKHFYDTYRDLKSKWIS